MIKVLFFGRLSEIATQELGNCEIDFIPEKKGQLTLYELRQAITKNSITLAKELDKEGYLYAINQTICHSNQMINEGDEVAFMSPLSGG